MFDILKNFKNKWSASDDWFNSSEVDFRVNDSSNSEEELSIEDNLKIIEKQNTDQWDALLRGQVLSATSQKIFNYITLADQKAQMVIILNSIIIPLAMSEINNPDLRVGATIAAITAIISILLCIICIYPKRRTGRKPDGSINHLHFADIGRLKEHDFMARFHPIYNDKSKLAEEMIKDIHDVSRRILLPKFRWLKMAYITFFLGNLVAILYTIFHSWFQII